MPPGGGGEDQEAGHQVSARIQRSERRGKSWMEIHLAFIRFDEKSCPVKSLIKIPLEVDVGDGDLLLFPLIGDLSGGIGDEGEEEEGGVDDQLHDHAAQLLLHP